MTARYRIKSLNLLKFLLTVEEVGVPGEFRLLLNELLTRSQIWRELNTKDAERILALSKLLSLESLHPKSDHAH